jgi:pimeloyl-ACP methyl ester carboxylesterase
VGGIAWAPALQKAGLNLLAIDVRAHGASGGSIYTGGKYEADDLEQVINQVRQKYPLSTKKLFLFGISLGAYVSAEVATRRSDIDGIILESPVVCFRSGLVQQAELARLPGGAIRLLAIQFAQWAAGARFDEISLLNSLPRVTCPKLLILPANDPIVTEPEREEMKSHATEAWTIPDAGHLQALEMTQDEYTKRVSAFLSAHRT